MTHHFDVADAERHGLPAAVILYNLRFWVLKNKANDKHQHDGRTWTYSSARAFRELFPYLSEDTIQRTLKYLVNEGVLIKGNFNDTKYDRTNWYAFTDESFLHRSKTDKETPPTATQTTDSAQPRTTTPQKCENDTAISRYQKSTFAESINSTYIKTDVITDERESTRPRRKISGEEEKPDWKSVAEYFEKKAKLYLDEQTMMKLSTEFYTYGQLHGFSNWQKSADLWIARKADGARLLAVQKAKQKSNKAILVKETYQIASDEKKPPISQQRGTNEVMEHFETQVLTLIRGGGFKEVETTQ